MRLFRHTKYKYAVLDEKKIGFVLTETSPETLFVNEGVVTVS